MTNLASKLRHLPGVLRLARAQDLIGRGEWERAVPLLEAAVLPAGLKHIAMVMQANCHRWLNQKDRAILTYAEAIEAERAWGGRSSPDVSAYVIGYAEFFRSVTLRSKYGGHVWDDIGLYDKLLSLRVSDTLKWLLPLPNRSSLRRESR